MINLCKCTFFVIYQFVDCFLVACGEVFFMLYLEGSESTRIERVGQ